MKFLPLTFESKFFGFDPRWHCSEFSFRQCVIIFLMKDEVSQAIKVILIRNFGPTYNFFLLYLIKFKTFKKHLFQNVSIDNRHLKQS